MSLQDFFCFKSFIESVKSAVDTWKAKKIRLFLIAPRYFSARNIVFAHRPSYVSVRKNKGKWGKAWRHRRYGIFHLWPELVESVLKLWRAVWCYKKNFKYKEKNNSDVVMKSIQNFCSHQLSLNIGGIHQAWCLLYINCVCNKTTNLIILIKIVSNHKTLKMSYGTVYS